MIPVDICYHPADAIAIGFHPSNRSDPPDPADPTDPLLPTLPLCYASAPLFAQILPNQPLLPGRHRTRHLLLLAC